MNIPDDIFVRDYKGIGLAFATRRDCEIVRLDYLKDLNLPKYPLMFDEEKQEFNWNFIREWFYLDEGKKYEKYLISLIPKPRSDTSFYEVLYGVCCCNSFHEEGIIQLDSLAL
jgi:hypothetical protein